MAVAHRVAASRDVVAYVVMTFRVYPEGKQYVAECVELGTASCGETIDEAFANIQDATVLYLNAIGESGERERIFRRRNIRTYLGHPHDEKTFVTASYGDVVSPFVHEFVVRPKPEAVSPHRAPASAML